MNHFKPNRLPSLLLLGIVAACGAKNETVADIGMDLALKEEMTLRDNAVVWLYDNQGNHSTHWIRSSAAGVEVIASRDDLVIPAPGELWRLEIDPSEDDVDVIPFRDLVSDETFRIVLDETVADEPAEGLNESDDGPDGGVADTSAENTDNPSETAASDASEDTEAPNEPAACDDYFIQDAPTPLASLGPYLFLRFEERRYNCDDMLKLAVDRFIIVDVANRTTVDLLTDEELDTLLQLEDLEELERTGEVTLDGMTPFYNPAFELSIVYTFAARSTFTSEDGEPQSLVSMLELTARDAPKALLPYLNPPEVVRAFGLMIPATLPGGWWRFDGTPEELQKQIAAFLPDEARPPKELEGVDATTD